MSRKSRKEKQMKKKTIASIIVAAVVLLVTAAILIAVAVNNENLDNHDHSNASEVTLKVGLSEHEGEIHYKSIQKFKEEVERESNGSIIVEIYGAGKLGNDQVVINSLQEKERLADIVISDVSNFTAIDERMDISSLPFLFENNQEAYDFVDGEIQKEIEDALLDKNVRVLAHYSDGFAYMTTNNDVITDVSDLQDMNFAVEEEGYHAIAMRMLQARTTLLETGKVQNALGKGQCDGYIGSLKSIYEGYFYRVQKNLVVTYQSYNAMAFAISENAWKSLSQEQQQIVKAAAESSAQVDRKMMEQEEKNIIKNIEATGVHILYPNLKSFEKTIAASIQGYQSKYGNLINDVIKFMQE